MVYSLPSAEHFRNDDAARAYLETVLWPDGPVCSHCGTIDHVNATKQGRLSLRRSRMPQGFHRDHENGHGAVEDRPAQVATGLPSYVRSSKKGISAHQLHRTLDIGYEAAWFMCHRIREAMRDGSLEATWAVAARSWKPL